MKTIYIFLAVIALFAAAVALEPVRAQTSDATGAAPTVEQRLVRYFDNDATAAVQRVLRACDAIQERVYAGAKVHVKDELIAHIMAIEEEDVQKIVDKVKPDIVNAGLQVEYVIRDDSGQVLTSGVVGAEAKP